MNEALAEFAAPFAGSTRRSSRASAGDPDHVDRRSRARAGSSSGFNPTRARANAERAASAVGDLAHGASGLGSRLEDTMKDIQDAAAGRRIALGDELERDPDMLLKGRSRYKR